MESKDYDFIAYGIFFFLGIGFLLPWNAFVTAVDYFDDLYPNAHIDYVFSVAYMVPNLIVLTLLMLYGRHYTSRFRIYLGFCLFLILIILVPLMDLFLIHGGSGNWFSLTTTVASVFFAGGIDAIVQGSLFGFAGELPPCYTQSLVSGTAASGVFISLLRIITKASLPSTQAGLRISANIYFCISAGIMALCIFGFHHLQSLPLNKSTRSLHKLNQVEENEPKDAFQTDSNDRVGYPTALDDSNSAMEQNLLSDVLTVESHSLSLQHDPHVNFKEVWEKTWVYCILLVAVYIVTLSIYPGFISELHSDDLGDWYSVLLMASYNLFDLVGKMIPAFVTLSSLNSYHLAIATFSRFLFYPLFALALLGPSYLRAEAPTFFLTSLLGASNGTLTSLLMMASPTSVALYQAETAGVLTVFFLVLGLFLGSISSWLWLLL